MFATQKLLTKLIAIISIFAIILLFIAASKEKVVGLDFYRTPNPFSFRAKQHLTAKLDHAEKLWKQSVDSRKEMVAASGSRAFPDDYIYPFNVWDFARPSFFCPHDLERVGSLGDGGKVVCGMSRYELASPGPSSESNPAEELIVYSFGVSDDSSFEADMLKRTNAVIWGYDFSVDSWTKDIPQHQLSRASFHKVAIGKTTNKAKGPPFYTLQDLMKENGHSYVDLVKMDIEGAEYDAMTSLISSLLEHNTGGNNHTLPFGQILMEIHLSSGEHDFSVPNDISSWINWWESMEKLGLRPVNNEDNWVGDVVYGKPRFMEVR
ncbi:hypothetical protein QQS21_007949 [Conoideocrella luteorostrata]|uniref:Methyltransferase domain-containing protein n=1 Tax=Conoideocrella luteorostrata TaxID=1105319 RepID=A0AAJ0CM51_9HYPO|nr:hypothetical protein QQS21_007949 [Conoideocrella luteorostrata]